MGKAQVISMRFSFQFWTMMLLTTCCVLSSNDGRIRQTISRSMSSSFQNHIFSSDILFEVNMTSVGLCAAHCGLYEHQCWSFTFTQAALPAASGICRGHSSVMSSSSTKVPSAETRVFFIMGDENWLHSACTQDEECNVANAECFAGACLCTPGYFYSHSLNHCVESCDQSDLKSTFIEYQHRAISGNNIVETYSSTMQGCLNACLVYSYCVSFDYNENSNACAPQAVTARQVSAPDWYSTVNYNYHQRTCA